MESPVNPGRFRFSINVLNDMEHRNWGEIEKCDHRTLQGAHDLLAAAWRFENDSRQGMLKFAEEETNSNPEYAWLQWLGEEIDRWIRHPDLVRSVQLILASQNEPVGYLAESQLCLGIMNRFVSVPWGKGLREAYEQDLVKDENLLS